MTVKIRNIDRWQKLPAGELLQLPGGVRPVTIEFNVDHPTRIDVVRDRRDPVFLVAVQPGEVTRVQFGVKGDCALVATTDGEVWYDTDDGAPAGFAVTTESYTRLEQRMEITPAMEITMLKADVARERRHREVAQLLLTKRQREQAAAANADSVTGEVDGEAQEPVDADAGTAEPAKVAGNKPAPKPEPPGNGNTP